MPMFFNKTAARSRRILFSQQFSLFDVLRRIIAVAITCAYPAMLSVLVSPRIASDGQFSEFTAAEVYNGSCHA